MITTFPFLSSDGRRALKNFDLSRKTFPFLLLWLPAVLVLLILINNCGNYLRDLTGQNAEELFRWFKKKIKITNEEFLYFHY